MAWAAVAGAAIGVVGSSMSDGGGGGSATQSKEPWEPTRQPLIDSIKTGQDLERYYQQNPFNQQQQTGYQNLFSDLDMFRNQMAPGLMQFANNAMSSGYQRPQYSQPGMAGYGGTAPTNQGPGAGLGGLLSLGQQPAQQPSQQPARPSYGRMDFAAANPHTSGAMAPPPQVAHPQQKTPQQLAQEEWERMMSDPSELYRGAGA